MISLTRRSGTRVFALLLTMAILTSCGYHSYVSYYITSEQLARDFEYKTHNTGDYLMSERLGGLRITLRLAPVFQQEYPRDWFHVVVLFSVDSAAAIDNTAPRIDSLIITSNKSGYRESLIPIETSFARGEHRVEFPKVHLERKHQTIEIAFAATLLTEGGADVDSVVCRQSLVRWENRNWLGLE